MLLDQNIWVGTSRDGAVCLLPKMANRHGLISGATGTGKTVTLQVLAEGFSRLGVPVFLADALLGAAALGDIGRHFPDSDPKYKGISSLILLEQTVRLIGEAGFRPVNADVTIVAQAPKLAPYILEMRENVARALGLPVSQVSVKATTTEHMGFEGRGEGISAMATALLIQNPGY